MEEEETVIFDNGTFKSRLGFRDVSLASAQPRSIIPSVVGHLREDWRSGGKFHNKNNYFKDSYVGDDVQSKRGILNVKNPIEHGIVTNWDDMEKLWHHSFYNELRVAPEETKVFLTECVVNPKANKEKIFQIMFESFNTPATFVNGNAVSTLYANGVNSGIVLKIGHGITRAIPIVDGHVIKDAITTCNFGGSDLTMFLNKLINQKGYRIGTTFSEVEFVQDIKEKCCRITMDYDKRMGAKDIFDERAYELPNGAVITVDEIGYTCTESIFQPSLILSESIGIHEAIYNSIMKCDVNARKSLGGSVFLSGGTSKLIGIDNRLQKELDLLSPSNQYKLSVKSNIDERGYSSYLGSAIMCSMDNFRNQWITKQYYDEHGTSFLYRRVF